jgi:hypothetical protein
MVTYNCLGRGVMVLSSNMFPTQIPVLRNFKFRVNIETAYSPRHFKVN